MADEEHLEVKEGILLDRDGFEISRPEGVSEGTARPTSTRGRTHEVPFSEFLFTRTQGSATRLFQLGPVAKFIFVVMIPAFFILAIALIVFFIVGATVAMVLRSVFKILGLIR